MEAYSGFRELLGLLNAHRAEHIVVGAHGGNQGHKDGGFGESLKGEER